MSRKANGTELNQSFYEVWRSFIGVVQASYALAPCLVIVLTLVIAGVTWIAIFSTKLMIGVVLLLVLAVGIVVYVTTEKYGEAALALVGGLLTAYSVTWTPQRFIAFIAVWSAFSFIALMVASIKLASRSESIYRQAALVLADDVEKTGELEARLKSIGDDKGIQGIGPIERAEAIRLFVYRRVPLDIMPQALKAVAMLSVIMQLPAQTVAAFVADVYRVFEATTPAYSEAIIDLIYSTIRQSAAGPADFITAFQSSRRLVLSRSLDPISFFAKLQEGLEAGVAPEAMADFLITPQQDRDQPLVPG